MWQNLSIRVLLYDNPLLHALFWCTCECISFWASGTERTVTASGKHTMVARWPPPRQPVSLCFLCLPNCPRWGSSAVCPAATTPARIEVWTSAVILWCQSRWLTCSCTPLLPLLYKLLSVCLNHRSEPLCVSRPSWNGSLGHLCMLTRRCPHVVYDSSNIHPHLQAFCFFTPTHGVCVQMYSACNPWDFLPTQPGGRFKRHYCSHVALHSLFRLKTSLFKWNDCPF